MILNQSAAKLLFPGRDALGQQVMNAWDKTSYQVVAVVGDTKYQDLRETAPPNAYVPIMEDPQDKPSLSAVVRMGGGQASLAGAAREMASRLAPTIPAPVVTTMTDVLNGSITAEGMMAVLSVFFAGCALLVTGIGLYGTLAYSTARRTGEIGIRMALGAQRAGSHGDGLQRERGDRRRRLGGRTDRGPSRITHTGKLPLQHVAQRSVGAHDFHSCIGSNRQWSYSSAGIASGAD